MSDQNVTVTGLGSFAPVPQMNLIESNDFDENLNELPNRLQPPNLTKEQHKDEIIREVFTWLENGKPEESFHLPIATQIP